MRKYIKNIFVLLIFIVILTACNAPHYDQERNQKWIADLNQVETELPEKHINLFHQLSKQDFYSRMDRLKKNVFHLNDDEIQVQLSEILASVGEAHTSENFMLKEAYPFAFMWLKDGIYCIDTIPKYKNILFQKLVKINHTDINSIVQKVTPVISHDNKQGVKAMFNRYMINYNILHGLDIIQDKKSIPFVFQSKSGKLITITVQTIKTKTQFINTAIKNMLRYENHKKNYWYTYLPKSKTVYFAYNSCEDEKDSSFVDFQHSLFDFMRQHQTDKLIIDLRNNGGGNSQVLRPFLQSFPALYPKLNQKGHLFVLIGRNTFSSAIINAYQLKIHTKAIVVGEPTGGNLNGYGDINGLTLKNSGIIISYSTKKFNITSDDLPFFKPDVEIENTLDIYENGTDNVIQYALNYKRNK